MDAGRIFESSSDKVNFPEKQQDFMKISWYQLQCSGSGQIPIQNNLNNYYQYISLYQITKGLGKAKLSIYNTENRVKSVKNLDTDAIKESTCITQLPNGQLFCYGGFDSGITMIIDNNYRVKILPSGTPCSWSSALYFDNNIYCFGGSNRGFLALAKKFDLEKNRWIDLAPIPIADYICHSVVVNRNILISGFLSRNLWLYSFEINSFSIIPYDFADRKRKVLINVERLYLIVWGYDGVIYESENEYDWNLISWVGYLPESYQMYCLYNKEKIYVSAWGRYYKFDLKKKVVTEILTK